MIASIFFMTSPSGSELGERDVAGSGWAALPHARDMARAVRRLKRELGQESFIL
jgi:hypothetical protein